MTSETWQALPYSADPADLQLAAGDALLRTLSSPDSEPPPVPVLRWYSMSPAALILGSSQKLPEFDLDACRRAGVALHKRSSGGTAVLAVPDQIMLDIALPVSHRLHSPDVTRSYRWLGAVWVAALADLGIAGTLIPIDEARADTQHLDALTRRSCYGGRSPFEVLADGRKLVGLAQVRRRQGVLLQTGIYVHWEPQRLVELFAMSPDERATLTARLTVRVAGLADLLDPLPAQLFPQVRAAFERALHALQGVSLVDTGWSEAAIAARAQAASRYAALDTG